MTTQDYHQLLANMLSGTRSESWPAWAGIDVPAFIASCAANGVTALIHDQLSRLPQQTRPPETLLGALRNASTHSVVFENQHARLLGKIGDCLAAAGIQPLVFKGSALAYQIYDPPFTRERCDTDLLFDGRQTALTAVEILTRELDFKAYNTAEGSLLSYEKAIHKTDAIGIYHELDIHWQISNNNVYGKAFSYQELYGRGITTIIGGHRFQTPAAVDALVIACLHRMANMTEGTENRLIWLYDIRQISNILDDRDWQQLLQRVTQKQVAHACLDGIVAAQTLFGTRLPPQHMATLEQAASREATPTLFLQPGARTFMGNVMALPGWRLRAQLVLQTLFPPLAYMQGKYRFRTVLLAPLYYAWRIVAGVTKSLRRSR